jgi:hypothetical protein
LNIRLLRAWQAGVYDPTGDLILHGLSLTQSRPGFILVLDLMSCQPSHDCLLHGVHAHV